MNIHQVRLERRHFEVIAETISQLRDELRYEMAVHIDITPTWRSILPVLLAVYVDASNHKARADIYSELERMADIADRYALANKGAS